MGNFHFQIAIFVSLVLVCCPPLECKLHGGRDFLLITTRALGLTKQCAWHVVDVKSVWNAVSAMEEVEVNVF